MDTLLTEIIVNLTLAPSDWDKRSIISKNGPVWKVSGARVVADPHHRTAGPVAHLNQLR
jgi:hypothetical protein